MSFYFVCSSLRVYAGCFNRAIKNLNKVDCFCGFGTLLFTSGFMEADSDILTVLFGGNELPFLRSLLSKCFLFVNLFTKSNIRHIL